MKESITLIGANNNCFFSCHTCASVRVREQLGWSNTLAKVSRLERVWSISLQATPMHTGDAYLGYRTRTATSALWQSAGCILLLFFFFTFSSFLTIEWKALTCAGLGRQYPGCTWGGATSWPLDARSQCQGEARWGGSCWECQSPHRQCCKTRWNTQHSVLHSAHFLVAECKHSENMATQVTPRYKCSHNKVLHAAPEGTQRGMRKVLRMRNWIKYSSRRLHLHVFSSCSLSRNIWGVGFAGGAVRGPALAEADTGDGFSSSVWTWQPV